MNIPPWIDEAIQQGMTLRIKKERNIWFVALDHQLNSFSVQRFSLAEALEALDTLMLESANIKIR